MGRGERGHTAGSAGDGYVESTGALRVHGTAAHSHVVHSSGGAALHTTRPPGIAAVAARPSSAPAPSPGTLSGRGGRSRSGLTPVAVGVCVRTANRGRSCGKHRACRLRAWSQPARCSPVSPPPRAVPPRTHPRLQQRLRQQVGAAACQLALCVPPKHAAPRLVPRARDCGRARGASGARAGSGSVAAHRRDAPVSAVRRHLHGAAVTLDTQRRPQPRSRGAGGAHGHAPMSQPVACCFLTMAGMYLGWWLRSASMRMTWVPGSGGGVGRGGCWGGVCSDCMARKWGYGKYAVANSEEQAEWRW